MNPRKSHKSLDPAAALWKIPVLKTLTVDAHKRIRIPDAQPRQVFAYEKTGDGRRILTEIQPPDSEPFPPGSLRQYLTPEFNREIEQLAKGSRRQLPE